MALLTLPAAMGLSVDQGPSVDPNYEDLPAQAPRKAWLQLVINGFVGVTAILFAVQGDGTHVTFASDSWRVVLAVVGSIFAFVSSRHLYRVVTGYRPRFDRAVHARARRMGLLFVVLGTGLLSIALVSPIAERTIEPAPWLRVGYGIAGVMSILVGLASRWNPTRHIQTQRVRSGEGIKGRARIVRAADTGVLVNEMPQVKIDFVIETEEDKWEASDKIVMQQAKLALLIPGSSVGVTVDRVNRGVFHLDWDDWRAAPAPPEA